MTMCVVQGHVTIRDTLNTGLGNPVEFAMDADGQITVRKADGEEPDPHRFDRVRGSLKSDMTTDEIMALLRGED